MRFAGAVLFVSVASGQYVGSEGCRACHTEKVASQGQTAHARALAKAPSQAPGLWAFGAGAKAITYVSPSGGDAYVEHGRTFFTALQSYGVTPGHKDAGDLKFRIFDPVASILRCFRCHSTGPIGFDGSAGIQPSEPGVHCEACHGPGQAHISAGGAVRKIRNPGRLNALEMNNYCGACHRKAPEVGEENDWGNAWNVRFQPAYLNKAACFRKSGGALRCTSCHDPHGRPGAMAAADSKRCSECHPRAVHRVATGSRSCVGCHMPQVRVANGLEFTNHWIGVYSATSRLMPTSRPQAKPDRLQLAPTAEASEPPPADPASLLPIFEDMLARREREPGPKDLKIARAASDLGGFLLALGRSSEAEAYLRKALMLGETSGDPGRWADAELLTTILLPQGRVREAYPLLEMCANGPMPAIAAKCSSSLGAFDDERAKVHYQDALRQQEAAYGKDDPKVAIVLNNLALALRRENDNKAAEPLFRRALAIQQKALGNTHAATAVTMNNLGSLLQSTGRLAEAERLERVALRVFETRLGPESKEVSTTCANLAELLWSRGDLAGAEQLYRKTLAIDEFIHGADDPEVAGDLTNLGLLLKESRRGTEAKSLLTRALAIFEKRLGPQSEQALTVRKNLESAR